MSKQDVISIDIPFPISEYEDIRELKVFHLIMPLRTQLSMAMQVDRSIVRAIALDEDDCIRARNGGEVEGRPHYIEFYDLVYTRDCRLSSVVGAEWETNYGPSSLNRFLMNEPSEPDSDEPMTIDSFMRVVCLRRSQPDLRSLNQRYGRKHTRSS